MSPDQPTILIVAFETDHAPEIVRELIAEDHATLRAVPGLVEKYFLADPRTGAARGIYEFERAADCRAYLDSDFVAALSGRYAIRPDSLRIEQLALLGTLRWSHVAAAATA